MRSDLSQVAQEIKEFITNPNRNPHLAETPEKAIVSIKSQRGTKYSHFIAAVDEVKEAYYQIYGQRVGLTSDEFRQLDKGDPVQLQTYLKARENLPMNISIANPDKTN